MADESEPRAVEESAGDAGGAVTTAPTDAPAEGVSDGPDPEAQSPGFNEQDIDGLLAQAEEAERTIGRVEPDAPDHVSAMAAPELVPRGTSSGGQGFELLDDVQLDVKIELGRCQMYVDEVLRLSEGAVVQLEKLAGDPVDILVNDKLVARGEVLVLNDNFCVRVGEILNPDSP